MGNKDEKTFTDIFSSVTNDDTPATQTFTDILNSDESITEPDNQSITFDNLFDQASESLEAEEENSSSNQGEVSTSTFNPFATASIDAFPNENTSISIPSEELTPAISAPEITNPFFSNEDSNPEEVETNANNIFENNDITQEENSMELDLSINPFMNSETYQSPPENTIDTKPSDTSFGENPFFKAVSNPNLNQNPFFDDKSQTTSDSSLSIFDANPSTTTPLNNASSSSEAQESKEINPFFEENNNQPEESPFFVNNTQTTSDSSLSILDATPSPTTESNKEPSVPEVQEPKSISPFFEENNNHIEENPFFQNQINLIENQAPPSSKGTIDTTKSKHYNVKIVKKKEPLIKVILGVLSYALFIWLLLVGVTLLIYVLDIKIRAAKGDYSSPTFNAYVVLTGSMLPEIQVNDVVITKKVDASELKERDIITFASADSRFRGTIITHRIIKKNPPTETEGYTFQTRGDNNNVADNALVPESNIYGKVILKIPKLGYLQEFLATDGGWIVVILIPCLTVMSYDIVKLIKGIKRKKYKNIKVQK